MTGLIEFCLYSSDRGMVTGGFKQDVDMASLSFQERNQENPGALEREATL